MTTEHLLDEIAEKNAEIAELKLALGIAASFPLKVRMECRKRSESKGDFFDMIADSASRAIDKTPSQSLAGIKAEGIIEAANSLCINGCSVKTVRYDKYIEYAEKLRGETK